MTRRLLASTFLTVLAVASIAAVAQAGGPPPPLAKDLTAAGRLTWNLDALLHDTFGVNPTVCYDAERGRIFAVSAREGCPTPWQRYIVYSFTFTNARDSALKLVRLSKTPLFGVTDVPVFLKGHYISCPHGQYHHGRTGLLMAGGDTPVGTFWCY